MGGVIAGQATGLGLSGVVVGDRTIDAAELAQLVSARRLQLGQQRKLVLLAGGNSLEFVVTYLAARANEHPVILAGDDPAELVDRYSPDAVVIVDGENVELSVRHDHSAHRLHPDLAVLLSTSGSTGAPKLVRLSARNLDTNARSIAQFQQLDASDRGITSLPLHYCYGLSVLNAHAAAGGSLVITDTSVVDPCFWDAMERFEVTNLAGVPHTFELIQKIGVERLALPSLRLVTQAGGRMPHDSVRTMAQLGQRSGWDFVVMYGQTEATARMAYLPADLALEHPDRVGVAIPGGLIRIQERPDLDLDPGVGEVVYRGPNVMMGYAEQSFHLDRGHDLTELTTGDLGRIDEHGLLEIVGRSSRIAKVFGLRIDLSRLEGQLADRGVEAICASDDSRLVVATTRMVPALETLVAALTSVPVRSIDVAVLDPLPRLANGKPDYQMLLAEIARPAEQSGDGASRSIDSIFSDVFGVAEYSGDATFASLGGDSFSYVEVSIRIEQSLGFLPAAWHLIPLSSLRAMQPRRRSRWFARIETNVVLRAFAIVAVVCTHMHIARIPAGAHILLAVVGFNYARFLLPQMQIDEWWPRTRRALTPVVRIAAATSAWIASQMLLIGEHGLPTLLLVNNYLGSPEHSDGRWRYWFFEAIVQLMLVLVVVFSFARARAFERRHPFLMPLLLLIPAAAMRFELIRLVDRDMNYIYRPDTLAWCFLLGWAAARAASTRQRLIVSVLALLMVPGFFDFVDREVRLLLAVGLLVWLPTLPVPRVMARPVGWVASASMWIFMTHWLVWPQLVPYLPRIWTFVATIAVGVLIWAAARSVGPAVTRLAASFRQAERFQMVEHRRYATIAPALSQGVSFHAVPNRSRDRTTGDGQAVAGDRRLDGHWRAPA